MPELDTETKTILHYAKKIRECCKSHKICVDCPLSTESTFKCKCYFTDIPDQWPEVDLHE